MQHLTRFTIGDAPTTIQAIDLGVRDVHGDHAVGVLVNDLREYVTTMTRVDPNGTWGDLRFLVTEEGLILQDADDHDGDWATYCPVMPAEEVESLAGRDAMLRGTADSPWVRLSAWEFKPAETQED